MRSPLWGSPFGGMPGIAGTPGEGKMGEIGSGIFGLRGGSAPKAIVVTETRIKTAVQVKKRRGK